MAAEPRSLDTLAVHAGRADLGRLGVHAPPLDLSSTYPIPDLEAAVADLDALAGGRLPANGSPVYGRLHNPTVRRFEEALAALELTDDAVAFSSGMAALTATLLAACRDRRHVVAVRPLYGGTDHLLACGLLGYETSWVTADGIEAAVRADTGLVLLETPQNPTLGTVDIARAVRDAGWVPVAVDNTFATPVLQNPAALGASLVVHSATKFLGGHGDVIAGAVATSSDWATRLRRVRVATGSVLHPFAAYLLHRSLPTLPLRVRAAELGARALAQRLAAHPAVVRVLYPRADGTQLRGPGAVLSFEVEGGFAAAARVLATVRLITPAVSLGATDTLIEHPAGLTHRLVDAEAKAEAGITDGLLRLSVGLEDPSDLWADLSAALASAAPRAGARRARRPATRRAVGTPSA